jgi:hypothetical protein
MELKKASSADFEERIKFYKSKTNKELKSIVPLWAYGENIHHLMDSTLNPRDKEHQIFLVDTKELMSISEFYEVNTNFLFNGEMLNDGRVATILYRWDNKNFVDPSSLGLLNRYKEKLCFSDGRHRAKTTYLLGHNQMPIAIHQTEIDDIRKMIQLIPT